MGSWALKWPTFDTSTGHLYLMVNLPADTGINVMGIEMEKAVEKVAPIGGDRVAHTCAGLVPPSSKATSSIFKPVEKHQCYTGRKFKFPHTGNQILKILFCSRLPFSDTVTTVLEILHSYSEIPIFFQCFLHMYVCLRLQKLQVGYTGQMPAYKVSSIKCSTLLQAKQGVSFEI